MSFKFRNEQENFLTANLIADKAQAIEMMKKDGSNLQVLSAELRDDSEVVFHAVSSDGLALCWASQRLKDDKEFAIRIMGKNGAALAYLSERLQDDDEVVMAAIKNNPNALLYASSTLIENRAVVWEAITRDGMSISFASHALQLDKEIALAAVQSNPKSLLFLHEWHNDKEVVLYALKGDVTVLKYASKEIRNICTGKDPVKLLETLVLNEQLEDTLPTKFTNSTVRAKL